MLAAALPLYPVPAPAAALPAPPLPVRVLGAAGGLRLPVLAAGPASWCGWSAACCCWGSGAVTGTAAAALRCSAALRLLLLLGAGCCKRFGPHHSIDGALISDTHTHEEVAPKSSPLFFFFPIVGHNHHSGKRVCGGELETIVAAAACPAVACATAAAELRNPTCQSNETTSGVCNFNGLSLQQLATTTGDVRQPTTQATVRQHWLGGPGWASAPLRNRPNRPLKPCCNSVRRAAAGKNKCQIIAQLQQAVLLGQPPDHIMCCVLCCAVLGHLTPPQLPKGVHEAYARMTVRSQTLQLANAETAARRGRIFKSLKCVHLAHNQSQRCAALALRWVTTLWNAPKLLYACSSRPDARGAQLHTRTAAAAHACVRLDLTCTRPCQHVAALMTLP